MKHSKQHNRKRRIAAAISITLSLAALAQTAPLSSDTGAPVKSLGVVTVTGGQPTSLPTQIPTTIEGVTRAQIEQTTKAKANKKEVITNRRGVF